MKDQKKLLQKLGVIDKNGELTHEAKELLKAATKCILEYALQLIEEVAYRLLDYLLEQIKTQIEKHKKTKIIQSWEV